MPERDAVGIAEGLWWYVRAAHLQTATLLKRGHLNCIPRAICDRQPLETRRTHARAAIQGYIEASSGWTRQRPASLFRARRWRTRSNGNFGLHHLRLRWSHLRG